MTTSRRFALAGLATMGTLAALPATLRAEVAPVPLEGTWWGTLQIGPTALRLQLEAGPAGEAELISLDQGNSHIPATVARNADGTFLITAQAIGATYRVRRTAENGLDGTFTQGGLGLTLTMQPGAAPAGTAPPAQ